MVFTVEMILDWLESHAPTQLAESWDNVGLLLGDAAANVTRVMTCLTLTPDVAKEAVFEQVELVVTHHPVMFRPIQRITTDTNDGRTLWNLAKAGVSIASYHTAYDSAAGGINQQWAERLGLLDVVPLLPPDPSWPEGSGTGRLGRMAAPIGIDELAIQIGRLVGLASLQVVGGGSDRVSSVAIACGSGGGFVDAALASGASVLLTGEASFHQLLAAREAGLGAILLGHFASERFACETLAIRLGREFPGLLVWASRSERDPLRTLPIRDDFSGPRGSHIA